MAAGVGPVFSTTDKPGGPWQSYIPVVTPVMAIRMVGQYQIQSMNSLKGFLQYADDWVLNETDSNGDLIHLDPATFAAQYQPDPNQ